MTVMQTKQGESPSAVRQRWLETCLKELRPYFAKAGYTIPENLRISVGWGYGGAEKILGQCWPEIASSDKHHEIFIAPSLADGPRIIGVVIHEAIHATVGTKAGHKGPFKQAAIALGLEGKMTATVNGPAVNEWAAKFIAKHGAYPAGSLNKDKGRKKQGTRLLKCECETCGYIVRTTAKWIEEAGAPHCGYKSHGRMSTEGGEGDED